MTISEQDRPHLLVALEKAIGKEAAMTLAEHLPPVGWADVATRHDLDVLGQSLRMEMHAGFAEVRGDMHAEFARQTRHLYVAFVSSLFAFGGLVLAAATLSR